MSNATLSEHRRLAVLRFLAEVPSYSANSSILLDVVTAVGVDTSEDQLRSTLSWLEEQELITTKSADPLIIATATARGINVAEGRITHHGVKRPSARS